MSECKMCGQQEPVKNKLTINQARFEVREARYAAIEAGRRLHKALAVFQEHKQLQYSEPCKKMIQMVENIDTIGYQSFS